MAGTLSPPQPMCEACRGLGWLREEPEPGEPPRPLVPCECKRAERQERRLADLLGLSTMLPSEAALMLDDVVARGKHTPKMVDLARRFVAEPWGFLTFWGGYGNGKTLVLQAIVNEMRERGRDSAYTRLRDILDYMRGGFEDWSVRKRYDRLREIEVLAIDEMDGPRMTDYAYDFRSGFLDERYRWGVEGVAHTIFAMNVDPETLPGNIGDRLRDGRFKVFENRDASMRPAMQRAAVGVSRGACDNVAIRAVPEACEGAARLLVSGRPDLSAEPEVGGNGADQPPPGSQERGHVAGLESGKPDSG